MYLGLSDFLNPCWNKTKCGLVKASASSCGHLPSSLWAGCLFCPPARGSVTDYQLHLNGSPGPCSLLAHCRGDLILVLCSSITESARSSLIPLTTLGLFAIIASPWPKLLITAWVLTFLLFCLREVSLTVRNDTPLEDKDDLLLNVTKGFAHNWSSVTVAWHENRRYLIVVIYIVLLKGFGESILRCQLDGFFMYVCGLPPWMSVCCVHPGLKKRGYNPLGL